MNIIKFNNTEFEVESYNKSTYFGGESITSNATCSLLNANVNSIYTLAQETITSIVIKHDGNEIYNLSNISARLDNSDEYLAGDRMNITLRLIFDNVE